jgi:putative phage-type endonuclease
MEHSMKIIDLRQRTAVWHAWRAKGITASESAVILGRSRYKTARQLWNERIGFVKPDDPSRKPCVQRGNAFEDHVRKGFEDRHNTILLPLCVESAEHSVLRASLDGLNDDGEPAELKVPTETTYRKLVEQGEQATAYQLAWVQLQHQLFVTEAGQGWLVFDPCLPGASPLEFCIRRYDDFLRNELIPACLAFWGELRAGQMPDPDSNAATAPSFYF